jgi:hypothetical protein
VFLVWKGEAVSKRSLSCLAVLALWLVWASSASAVSITVQVGSADAVDVAGVGSIEDFGDFQFWQLPTTDANGDPLPYNAISGASILQLNALLKEDPFVTLNFTVINNTAFTQTYTFTVSLPVAPPFPFNATIASSVGVTVTDSDPAFDGSVTAQNVAPEGIYSGQVNGATVLTLMPNPTTVSCAIAPRGCSTTLADNSGLPSLPAGPGVATSIGIQIKLTLTAGDQVGVTSRFEIVPEPTVAALLGVGLVALVIARRRAA